MRKVSAILAAVAAAAVLVLAGAPAASASTAAYPTTLFSLAGGNSNFSGEITWYNRSVGIWGSLNAVGCRRVYGISWAGTTPLDERSSSTHCNTSPTLTIPLEANVPGGASHVYISLTDETGRVLDDGYFYRP